MHHGGCVGAKQMKEIVFPNVYTIMCEKCKSDLNFFQDVQFVVAKNDAPWCISCSSKGRSARLGEKIVREADLLIHHSGQRSSHCPAIASD